MLKAARLVALMLALVTVRADAAMTFATDGDWAAGSFGTTDWEDGSFLEGAAAGVQVPTVTGESSTAAADAILEAVGLDLGGATDRCSSEPDNEVVGQSPQAGEIVDLGSLVYVTVSNGVECEIRGRSGVRLRGLRMPGL